MGHTAFFPPAAALCNLLFNTSAGAHTVVATVPAAREARMCTGRPSVMGCVGRGLRKEMGIAREGDGERRKDLVVV